MIPTVLSALTVALWKWRGIDSPSVALGSRGGSFDAQNTVASAQSLRVFELGISLLLQISCFSKESGLGTR